MPSFLGRLVSIALNQSNSRASDYCTECDAKERLFSICAILGLESESAGSEAVPPLAAPETMQSATLCALTGDFRQRGDAADIGRNPHLTGAWGGFHPDYRGLAADPALFTLSKLGRQH